jgi:hypothetical protein
MIGEGGADDAASGMLLHFSNGELGDVNEAVQVHTPVIAAQPSAVQLIKGLAAKMPVVDKRIDAAKASYAVADHAAGGFLPRRDQAINFDTPCLFWR